MNPFLGRMVSKKSYAGQKIGLLYEDWGGRIRAVTKLLTIQNILLSSQQKVDIFGQANKLLSLLTDHHLFLLGNWAEVGTNICLNHAGLETNRTYQAL